MRGRNILSLLILVQYIVPGYVTALSWGFIAGPKGLINNVLVALPFINSPVFTVYSLWGIILVGGIHYAGLVFLLVSGGLQVVPSQMEEAAKMCGASTRTIITKIHLPLILPSLLVAVLLVGSRFLQSFGFPLILGLRNRTFVVST